MSTNSSHKRYSDRQISYSYVKKKTDIFLSGNYNRRLKRAVGCLLYTRSKEKNNLSRSIKSIFTRKTFNKIIAITEWERGLSNIKTIFFSTTKLFFDANPLRFLLQSKLKKKIVGERKKRLKYHSLSLMKNLKNKDFISILIIIIIIITIII